MPPVRSAVLTRLELQMPVMKNMGCSVRYLMLPGCICVCRSRERERAKRVGQPALGCHHSRCTTQHTTHLQVKEVPSVLIQVAERWRNVGHNLRMQQKHSNCVSCSMT